MDDHDIDTLIARVNAGEPGAQDKLFAAAYGDLHKLARSRLRDGGRNTYLTAAPSSPMRRAGCARSSSTQYANARLNVVAATSFG